MNDYAIIDSRIPPRVVRLHPTLGSAMLEPGLRPVALPQPLPHWPEAPHADAELVWLDNALAWHDPRTLDQIKAAKNDQINAARLAANRRGFMFAGKLISTDELSRSDIDGTNGTVTLTGDFPAGWPGVWKTEDNSYVPIPDIETWKQFYAAMSAQGSSNFATSQALKAQLALAETIEQVEAVAWPS